MSNSPDEQDGRRPHAKRRAIFRRGSEALAHRFGLRLRELGIDEDVYVCPLCGAAYAIEATDSPDPELTVEHVPPGAAGGVELCLTCKSCNNGASSTLNAAAADRHKWEKALRGHGDHEVRGRAFLDGYEVGADMRFGGDGSNIVLNTQAARPRDAAGFVESLRRSAVEDVVLTLSVPIYDSGMELVSGLRDAYLIAFSALGYRYILRPELDAVRRQIQEPEVAHIRAFRSAGTSPRGTDRRIIAVREPAPGLMVDTGSGTYWLPPPVGSGDGIWQCLVDHDQETLAATGRAVPWPRRMELLWDWDRWSWY